MERSCIRFQVKHGTSFGVSQVLKQRQEWFQSEPNDRTGMAFSPSLWVLAHWTRCFQYTDPQRTITHPSKSFHLSPLGLGPKGMDLPHHFYLLFSDTVIIQFVPLSHPKFPSSTLKKKARRWLSIGTEKRTKCKLALKGKHRKQTPGTERGCLQKCMEMCLIKKKILKPYIDFKNLYTKADAAFHPTFLWTFWSTLTSLKSWNRNPKPHPAYLPHAAPLSHLPYLCGELYSCIPCSHSQSKGAKGANALCFCPSVTRASWWLLGCTFSILKIHTYEKYLHLI